MNLTEILKDCPTGTKLYSPIFGDVKFEGIGVGLYCIRVRPTAQDASSEYFLRDGRFSIFDKSEICLFPSRDNRDWSTFKVEKPKFDPKTLKPFDRVLVREDYDEMWYAAFFSHKLGNRYHCCLSVGYQCIPYNEETKHLVGTTDQAPEFYRL